MTQCPPGYIQAENSSHTLLSYRRSQASVKAMNATNETMVTTTTIRSSIQILLVKLRVLNTRRISIPLFSIFRACISALCRLRRQAQQGFYRKRFGQVGQGMKFSEPARAHA